MHSCEIRSIRISILVGSILAKRIMIHITHINDAVILSSDSAKVCTSASVDLILFHSTEMFLFYFILKEM